MKTLKSRRSTATLQPDIMPVLSAGRHRSPRSGACFMEFASFLAGERWSDHPSCTHAGLAHMARAVNDLTSNEGRSALAPLIPSVIGLTTDDPRLDLIIAVTAASAAIPIASIDRQHALAVGALVCQDALERAGGSAPIDVDGPLREALDAAPEAEAWARRFLDRNVRWRRAEISARQTHVTIAMSVDGVRSACAPFPDERLYALLESTIALSAEFVAREQEQAGTAEAAASSPAAPFTASAPPVSEPTARAQGDFSRHV
ncbi:hypothetical protein N1027_12205 [Herbiconiux sp. CPCC 205763]|uniref:DUF222 domain-containing protein n=1 Tax=Herbiconiux aconitum TaxID=2970913 RepID=A0ABT2GRU4_9MICO|nr:hypothetical protein [Herbiconiux aconitum]MCS5718898.1 hypothetical protein [Herbiconiux aconitum]